MQYSVPQFIDIEDKIVGPLTGKQTLYLLLGGAILFVAQITCDMGLFIVIAIPTIVFSLALAFYKPQGRTLAAYLKAAVLYIISPHIFIWKREISKQEIKRAIKKTKKELPKKAITKNRLRELAWILDTRTAVSDNNR